MKKLSKKHSHLKTLFDVLTSLERPTFVFLWVIFYFVICIIVSFFVKLDSSGFFVNVTYVGYYGILWIIGIGLTLALLYGIVYIINNVVKDVVSTYRSVKEQPDAFAIEDPCYDMPNTGHIDGGQTVLKAPYKCKVLNRPVADSKTVYERGNDLFVVSVGALIIILKSPTNLILTKLLVEPDTEIEGGEILAIYEKVQSVKSVDK